MIDRLIAFWKFLSGYLPIFKKTHQMALADLDKENREASLIRGVEHRQELEMERRFIREALKTVSQFQADTINESGDLGRTVKVRAVVEVVRNLLWKAESAEAKMRLIGYMGDTFRRDIMAKLKEIMINDNPHPQIRG